MLIGYISGFSRNKASQFDNRHNVLFQNAGGFFSFPPLVYYSFCLSSFRVNELANSCMFDKEPHFKEPSFRAIYWIGSYESFTKKDVPLILFFLWFQSPLEQFHNQHRYTLTQTIFLNLKDAF